MDVNSLSHTVNGIVSTILCLRQSSEERVAYGALRQDIANILSMLCKRKGVNIVEAEICRIMCICL